MARRSRLGGPQRRSSTQGFTFQDIDVQPLWSRLALTATQLSKLTGVSRRQVEWWRQRGYLTPSPENPDRFNGDAITLVLLIKQAIENGVPLHRAYDMAVDHLARRLGDGVAEDPGMVEQPDRTALLDLEQKLLAAHNTVALVLKAMEPLTARVEQELASQSSK